ncbi:MAG: hypothetical protein ACTHU0_14195 [Kofleriaceae bacterium]
MHRIAPLWLLLVAACPKPGSTPAGAPAAGPGVGCPAASDVYVASYLAPEEGGQSQGHTGWVLPLHDRVVDSVAGAPEYAQIDAAAATAAGVPAPPSSIWLLVPGGAPCKASIGAYYAAAIEGPTPNLAYGVELSGCAAPPDPSDASAIALASEQPPSECQVVPPRPVAARLGAMTQQQQWQRPTKETPIPPAFAAVVPPRSCAAPGCEMLWSVAQVDLGGKPVAWAGAVNWLEIPAGAGADQPCSWKTEAFSGFFVAGPDGAPVKVTEGQEHPLLLTGVLADRTGAKVLLAAGPGEYTSYDLSGGAATVGRHLVWLRPPPDAYEGLDHLGPDCAP